MFEQITGMLCIGYKVLHRSIGPSEFIVLLKILLSLLNLCLLVYFWNRCITISHSDCKFVHSSIFLCAFCGVVKKKVYNSFSWFNITMIYMNYSLSGLIWFSIHFFLIILFHPIFQLAVTCNNFFNLSFDLKCVINSI